MRFPTVEKGRGIPLDGSLVGESGSLVPAWTIKAQNWLFFVNIANDNIDIEISDME